MKKILLLILIILLTSTGAYAGPSISGGTSGGGGSGDVTAASDAQTWGGGTGPVVWTFSVTGTDPTISVATGAFTLNTDLALGANDITMTGSLGATGAGKLTKIWSVDAEFTNAPTVNGAAFKPADLAIASQAAGDILYFNGTNWVRLAKDAGKYLKSGDSAVSWDTPAGSGTVDVSGTPANHYWTGWTDADTIKGFLITASKPVCSDANGDPAVCAGTEGVWQVANADLATIAAGGSANCLWGEKSDSSGIECKSTINVQIDDSAAQFKSATASKGTLKFDQTGLTDGKVLTIKHTSADDYTYTPTFTGNTAITYPTSGTLATVGGALGTPSFTALNMPSSDADPGTTAGQIRHDSSDTAASAAGNAKFYDGTNVRTLVSTGAAYTLIAKSEYLPIRYAEDDDSVTAPAATAEIGTTSMVARSFAEDADNGVVFFWHMPLDYVSGIKFRVYFATDTNASANETAVFNLSGCAFASSGAIACSEGTGQESTLELTTDEDTGELLVSGWSPAITIGGSPASGQIAKLLLIRDVTGGSAEDDMAGHALVTGIEIKYVGKLNQYSDY
jgi:hypothetical protein